ncbi:MAG TPA: hypothetical protein VF546_00760 [Pyrinomonadaceae bacterium]|jgi:hypothetical protein
MRKLPLLRPWAGALLVGCAVVCFVWGAGVRAGERGAPSLAGTTWSGTDSDGDHYVFTFEESGTLAYRSPAGSYRNGKWHQFEGAVYFEMNDHYSEYLGQMQGDVLQGRAWNRPQHKWLWKVTRDR